MKVDKWSNDETDNRIVCEVQVGVVKQRLHNTSS